MPKKSAPTAITVHQAARYAKQMEVAAMLEAGFTYQQIIDEMGVAKNTIVKISNGLKKGEYPAPEAYVDQLRGISRARIAQIKGNLLRSIQDDTENEEKMGKTSMRDKSITYGVLDDKDRLDRGDPTTIVRHERGLSDQELARQASAVATQIRNLTDRLKSQGLYSDAIEAEYEEVEELEAPATDS